MNRHSLFCDQCGLGLEVDASWPKHCPQCDRMVYANPTPIAVTLIPVCHQNDVSTGPWGVLIGRRNHEPARGTFGLPGGFQDDVDPGETLRDAAVREVREEMGLHLDSNLLRYHYEYSNALRSQTLVFFSYTRALLLGEEVHLGRCDVSPECDFIDVAWNPTTLSFASHTQALELWFSNVRRWGHLGQNDAVWDAS